MNACSISIRHAHFQWSLASSIMSFMTTHAHTPILGELEFELHPSSRLTTGHVCVHANPSCWLAQLAVCHYLRLNFQRMSFPFCDEDIIVISPSMLATNALIGLICQCTTIFEVVFIEPHSCTLRFKMHRIEKKQPNSLLCEQCIIKYDK